MAKTKVACLVVLLVIGALSMACCGKSESPEKVELARVNDTVLTLEDFQREMEQLPMYLKSIMVSAQGKKEFLQRLIDRELLLREGEKKGLHKDERILAAVEQFKKGLIVQALLADRYEGKDEVTQEELEWYYRENKDKFLVGERIRVRNIVVKTLEEAEEIKKRLEAGEDFAELAKKYSISPNRELGGDLGYIRRGQTGEAFENAAFALKELGDISDIVKTSFGYHIIGLEERKEPYQRTLDDVKDEIKVFLQEKKRQEIRTAYLADLKRKYKIAVHEELLDGEEPPQ